MESPHLLLPKTQFKISRIIPKKGQVYTHSLDDQDNTIDHAANLNEVQYQLQSTSPFSNNKHLQSVESISYSAQSKFLYTGSVDASFGTWKFDLTSDSRFANPLFDTKVL